MKVEALGGCKFPNSGRAPERFQSSASAVSDSRYRALCDLSQSVAIIQGLYGAVKGSSYPWLAISYCDLPLSGLLAKLHGIPDQE